VCRGHPDVDNRELRFVLAYELEEPAGFSCLTDDLVAGPVEQAREAFAEKDVIVGDNDPAERVRRRIDDSPPYAVRVAASGYLKRQASWVGKGALIGCRPRLRGAILITSTSRVRRDTRWTQTNPGGQNWRHARTTG
jgi:hypothetical protein